MQSRGYVPPPRAPANGRPGFPGAGGRLLHGTAWAGFVASSRPSRGGLPATWRQAESTTARKCSSPSSSSVRVWGIYVGEWQSRNHVSRGWSGAVRGRVLVALNAASSHGPLLSKPSHMNTHHGYGHIADAQMPRMTTKAARSKEKEEEAMREEGSDDVLRDRRHDEHPRAPAPWTKAGALSTRSAASKR